MGKERGIAALSSIKHQRWLWIGIAGFFGTLCASVTTCILLWISDPARSALNQKLINYGSAFVEYIDQLPKAKQDEIYQMIKPHLQN